MSRTRSYRIQFWELGRDQRRHTKIVRSRVRPRLSVPSDHLTPGRYLVATYWNGERIVIPVYNVVAYDHA